MAKKNKYIFVLILIGLGCILQYLEYQNFKTIKKAGLKKNIEIKTLNNDGSEYYNYYFIQNLEDTVWITHNFNSKSLQYSNEQMESSVVYYLESDPEKFVISPYSPRILFNLIIIPFIIFVVSFLLYKLIRLLKN